ncbi:MAG TPA: hypothetical protein VG890_03070 [Puia sp.]|nr:hypothetical protein [Puia sp.]
MHYLPEPLIKSLKAFHHFDEPAFRSVHASGETVVSVRFNEAKLKIFNSDASGPFNHPDFQVASRVPWSSAGYYLTGRPSFTADPLFHAGLYYVQEASGMFLEQAMRQALDLSKPLRALDLCAAPGGKSTLIQSLISADSLLVSNEVIRTRVPALHQNLDKWGFGNGIVSNNDPAHFKAIESFFDFIMIDAPCSGSGLFRRDNEAISEWSPENVKLCSQRQQRILADAWPALKKEGILIYSTCSYSPEENEDILDYLLQQFDCETVRLTIDPAWHIEETISSAANGYGYRFYPDKLKGEGFFIAVLRKKDGTTGTAAAIREKPDYANKKEQEALRKYLPEESLAFIRIPDGIHAFSPNRISDLLLLKRHLYLKKAGVLAGQLADEWIPEHELALYVNLNRDIPAIELNREDALKYLRRDPFDAKDPVKGWQPVRFLGQNLGWVKVLTNRINNYYPKSWRILK